MRWRVGRRPAVRSRAFTALIGQEAGLFCGQGIWSAMARCAVCSFGDEKLIGDAFHIAGFAARSLENL